MVIMSREPVSGDSSKGTLSKSSEDEGGNMNLRTKRRTTVAEVYNKRKELFKEHFGYTNEDNPFGDTNLSQPFVWIKKGELMKTTGKGGLTTNSLIEVACSNVEEIKQVKQRREQYESEQLLLEQQRLELQRLRSEDSYDDWVSKEQSFSLKQIITKSHLRLEQGRHMEIDLFLAFVYGDAGDLEEYLPQAPNLFKDCKGQQLSDSIELVDACIESGAYSEFKEYLQALKLILTTKNGSSETGEISEEVSKKIDEILSVRSLKELKEYEDEINKRLESGVIVDTNFWEVVISRIPFFRACRTVEDFVRSSKNPDSDKKGCQKSLEESKSDNEIDKAKLSPKDGISKDTELNNGSGHSFIGKESKTVRMSDNEKYERFVKNIKLEEDEEMMLRDVDLTDSSKKSSTNRGRKPKYFNRIKAGFDWNKYNQTHYDCDNPPPKQVQGYKFNIFYPDLLDKTCVPKWKLERDKDSNETCIIRFSAGPPYEDLTFRIVNREWDVDPQRGFRNFFDNGILHLYFSFKKLRYRR